MAALGLLIGLLVPVVILLLATAAVFVVVRIRSGEPMILSFRTLLTAYFYILSLVSFLALAVGASTLLKVGLSEVFGRDFAYQSFVSPRFADGPLGRPTQPPEEIAAQEERERQRIEQSVRDDLLQGLTIVIVGGLVFGVHRWGRSLVEQPGEPSNPFMQRAYLTIQLAIFSIGGLIALIAGISDTLRYFILEPNPDIGPRVAPAASLATAIVFVPIWAYYLWAMLRQLRRGEGS